VVLGLRPEVFTDLALDPAVSPEGVVEVPVALVEALGAELVVHASAGIEQVRVDMPAADQEDALHRAGSLVARLSPKSRVIAGSSIKLAVDLTQIQLFDPDTGASLRAGAT
jgi:hypothetical protein